VVGAWPIPAESAARAFHAWFWAQFDGPPTVWLFRSGLMVTAYAFVVTWLALFGFLASGMLVAIPLLFVLSAFMLTNAMRLTLHARYDWERGLRP
jgi:hypothetical protein